MFELVVQLSIMDVPNREELKPQELGRINKGQPHRCPMCKFVLIFAFIALFLVLIFAFISRPKTSVPVQIPMQTTRPISHVEMDQRILDLKGTLNTSSKTMTHPGANLGVKPR